MTTETKFESWAIVEVMGHRSYGGRLSEREIAGHGFLQLDVPPVGEREPFTKIISPSSIYAITPVTEAVASAYAMRVQERPVQVWDLPRALPAPAEIGRDEGPCPRPCCDCEDRQHHWVDGCRDPDDPEQDSHPAVLAGHECWQQCKHCPAWRPFPDDDDDEVC